jgi:chromosome segregation ATPase
MSYRRKGIRGMRSAPGVPPGVSDARIAEVDRRHVQLRSDVNTKVELEAVKHSKEQGSANPESKTRTIVAGLESDIVARIEKIVTQRIDWVQLKTTIDSQVRNAFRQQFGDIMNEIEKRVADTLSYRVAGSSLISARSDEDSDRRGQGGGGCGGQVIDGAAIRDACHSISVRMDNLESRVSDFAGDLSTMNNSLNGPTGVRGQIHEVQREQYVLEHQKLGGFVEHIGKLENAIADVREKIPGIVKACFEAENKRFEGQLIARIKQQFDGKIDALRQRLVDTEKRAKVSEGELKKQTKLAADTKAQIDKNRDAKVEFETKSSRLQHELAGLRTQQHSIDAKLDRIKKKMDDMPEINALVDQLYNFEQRLKAIDNVANQKLKEQSTRLHQVIKEEIMASNAKMMAATKQMTHAVAADTSMDVLGEWSSGAQKASVAQRRISNANVSLVQRRSSNVHASISHPNLLAQIHGAASTVDSASLRQVEGKIEDILGQMADFDERIDGMREGIFMNRSSMQREDLAKYLAPLKGQLIEIEQKGDKTKERLLGVEHAFEGLKDDLDLLRAQMTDFVTESCRSMRSEIEDVTNTAGFDETELQIVRAESKQRLEELEASFVARQQATTDDLAKLRRSLKWEKDASTKRVNEVHEMISMQANSNQRTAAAVDTAISQVDMLMRKMAHVELLKRSVDGQMQELMHVKNDFNKIEIKVEDSVAASEALAAELRRRLETNRQANTKRLRAHSGGHQRAATDSGYGVSGPGHFPLVKSTSLTDKG